jgi:allophanate hydrolase
MIWTPETGALDLKSLRTLYAGGKITPVDVVNAIHDRIAARGDDGVWITLPGREDSIARAKAVMARGTHQTLPLYGVPFGIKDNFDLEGVATTMAVPAWSRIAETSSPTITTLIEAGAIPIGKQNMDQLGMGLVGVRTGYTVPACVFDDAYISGGSSSGGAVSVAANLVSFACANDAAGSGRVPAALNNIVGYKPTPGLVPRLGRSVAGMVGSDNFLTLNIADAVTLSNLWFRYDPEDPFSKPAAATFHLSLADEIAPFRFAVPDAASIDFDGDAEAERLFFENVARLETLGGTRVEIDISPYLTAARLLYEGPYIAQRYANFGPRMEQDPTALHHATAKILSWGRQYSAADLFEVQYRMGRYVQMSRALFRDIDVLVTPTSPSTYTIADMQRDNIALNAKMGTYTNFVNLLDLPAVSIPAGFRADGKSLGTMLIGPSLGDGDILNLGAALHTALDIAPGLRVA